MPRKVKCGLIQASCDWPVTKYSLPQIKERMIDKHVALIENAGKKGVHHCGEAGHATKTN